MPATATTSQASACHRRAMPGALDRRVHMVAVTLATCSALLTTLAASALIPLPEDHMIRTELVSGIVRALHSGETRHALGGRLRRLQRNGIVSVMAEDLPRKYCVQAAWGLAKQGVVTVNGVTPAQVTTKTLSNLCAKGNERSTLEWSPGGR